MSTGTPKENTANVESSVTFTLDAEKVREPEKFSYGEKRPRDPPRKTEEEHANLMDNSKFVVDAKTSRTRYFIIKSLNYDNIQLSVEKGIWATQIMNERILEEAYNSSHKVILVFSVNGSGFFQGYAEMISSVGRRRDSVWSQGAGVNNPWGRSFLVNWLRLSNLPFHKTLHLKNPLNEYKPVKISRDCQELPVEIGVALCELIDRESEEHPNLKSPGLDSGCSFPEATCNAASIDMTFAMASTFHPAYLYDYHSQASRWHLAHGSVGVPPPECLPVMVNKGALFSYTSHEGNMHNSPVESDVSSQVDSWSMSGEMRPLCSTITEDELLEMSYEEYLEAHARGTKRLHQSVGGQLQKKDYSSSKEHDMDDSRNRCDRVKSRKRSRR